MSKLIDRLHAASQAGFSPLGFGKAARTAPKPGLVLIACLSQDAASRAADLAAGADAIVWQVQDAALKKLPGKPSGLEMPFGLWLPELDREASQAAAVPEMDFAVVSLKSSVAVYKEEAGPALVFQVDSSVTDGQARQINDLPADAILLIPGATFLTWQQLLLVHRFASLVDAPLLFSLPPATTATELQMLWEAGVDGVVAEASEGAIASLRKQIDELHEPPARKRAKTGVLLPRVNAGGPAAEEEDAGGGEEDEEE